MNGKPMSSLTPMPLGKEIAWCHAAAGGTLDCGSLLPLSGTQPAAARTSRLVSGKRQQAAAVQGLALVANS